jgi:hypothetical protein
MATFMGYSTELYKKIVVPILLLVVSLFIIVMLFTYPSSKDLTRTITTIGNAAMNAKTAALKANM